MTIHGDKMCPVGFHEPVYWALRKKRSLRKRKVMTMPGGKVELQQLYQICPESELFCNRRFTAETNINYESLDRSKLPGSSDVIEIHKDSITLIRTLGQGAFGEVYEGLLNNVDSDGVGMRVAVKTITQRTSEQVELDFLAEALIMSKFNHENIVRLVGVSMKTRPLYIVLELLSGGDLKTFLRQSRPNYAHHSPSISSWFDLIRLALDVAKGCRYLERHHFVHRDIAARNCLLTSTNCDRIAKIADFGMARDIYRSDYYRKEGSSLLPVRWMPPEACLDGLFTSKADVWAFGVLCWEVTSIGFLPYHGRENQAVIEFVKKGGRLDRPQNCPKVLDDFMRSCWSDIPDQRPDFTSVVSSLASLLQDPEVAACELPAFPTCFISDA